MRIREEQNEDHAAVHALIQSAFESAEHADGNEAELVEALRKGKSFIEPLSLVAEIDGKIVGHILFTKAAVGDASVLLLAPLAVLPAFQRQGVGTALVEEGHRIAKALGFGWCIVLGSEKYYPRFGYLPASDFGIISPFEAPRENFMALKLDAAAPAVHGTVRCAEEFDIF